MNKYTPTVLTIAGSDPYGGAGLQIDTKVIHYMDCYAFSVPTAMTVQNSMGVRNVQGTDSELFRLQLEALLNDVKVDAVKIGMLVNAEIIQVLAETIDKYDLKNIVLDTVLVSSSGKILLEKDAITCMVEELFPRVDLITPNIPEINTFLRSKYEGKEDEVKKISDAFFSKGVKAVLIKGGHSLDQERAIDYAVSITEGITMFSSSRIKTTHTHGTGCFLSSAIAASLAKGERLEKSIASAKKFLTQRLENASEIQLDYIDKNLPRKEPLL
jgi:hydroxymethylpyrimidine/phosphomethylpyrimidine kinase